MKNAGRSSPVAIELDGENEHRDGTSIAPRSSQNGVNPSVLSAYNDVRRGTRDLRCS